MEDLGVVIVIALALGFDYTNGFHDAANSIALFAARRTGPDGRKGDTVGTYICSGLDCSAQLRVPTAKIGRAIIGANDADPDRLAVDMLARLDAFLASVGA